MHLYRHDKPFSYVSGLPLLMMTLEAALLMTVLSLLPKAGIPELPHEEGSTRLALSLWILGWILSSFIMSAYLPEKLNRYARILYYSYQCFILHAIVIMLTIGVNLSALDDFKLLLLYLLATAFSVFLFRTLALTLYRHYRKLPYNSRPSVIVGSNTNGVQLFHYFTENKHLKRDFRGIFANEAPADQQAAQHYKGNLGQLKSYCIDNSIKEIYYTLPEDHQFLDELKDFAESNFIYLGIIPNIKLVYDTRLGTQYFDDGRIAVISYRDTPLRRMINRHMKRAFDIFFASLALLLLIPTVLPLVALAIRLDSKGPIFFRQIRPGLHNRPFWCYKFRTMCVNGEQCRQATKNDSRITRVGSFLRKTSIDELPQFFNVLKGDMSVVGPRPNMVNQLEYYSKHIKDYPVRHTINPGITGYAQISGYRGETKEMHLMQKRIEYDLQYMYNWTLVLDLKIIWRTVLNIIKGEENAY